VPSESSRAALIDAFLRSRGPGAIVKQRMDVGSDPFGGSEQAEETARELGIPDAAKQLSRPSKLPRGVSAARRVVQASELDKLRSSSSSDFWSAFHKAYGDSAYLVELSPIAFSHTGKDAVFVASCYSGGLAGAVGVAHLRLKPGGWAVIAFEVFAVS
jgi:hypothetical protein